MRKDIQKILDDNNIRVELKGYKEMPSQDGYHMNGNLYVNGKRAINCNDGGFGGGLDISILNQDNAKPLLDIAKEFFKIPAYPDSPELKDVPYTIDTMFYEMAEVFLESKALKRRMKNNTLVRFESESYSKGSYTSFSHVFDDRMKKFLISEATKNGDKSISVWNVNQDWDFFPISDLLINS
jgi:hypothetical protein